MRDYKVGMIHGNLKTGTKFYKPLWKNRFIYFCFATCWALVCVSSHIPVKLSRGNGVILLFFKTDSK